MYDVIRYILQRLLQAAALLFLISVASFILARAAPGDYVNGLREDPRISEAAMNALRSRYGLDKPPAVQYALWMKSVLNGDFGYSFAYGVPVGRLLWPRARNTLLLTSIASGISWCLALAIGIVGCARERSAMRNFIRTAASLLAAIPDLLIVLALAAVAARTGLFPMGGMASTSNSSSVSPADVTLHLLLPIAALVLVSLPVLVRHTQVAFGDAMNSSFVRAARGFGIPRRRILLAYALPAAANPLISLLGFSVGGFLSASLIIEIVMGWPGLGPLMLEALFSRDIQTVIGVTLLSAACLIAGNLMADLLIYATDPRIRRDIECAP
jgi:peptide/nickel transport system permease protein